MARVAVAADGGGFVLVPSGEEFRPWGLNYGNAGRLIEDYWEAEWGTVAEDFGEMRRLGANTVRVHLQVGKFMEGPDACKEGALERLRRLTALAEEEGVYLDLTGLGCYRPADVPGWYDVLAEAERWSAQARFWECVAAVGARSRAVFCYDLMNEPLSPGERREPGRWYSGALFGGYDFIQWIALDPGERSREEIAVEWIRTLTAAIRRQDGRALVTAGLLPSTPEWGHFSGFLPEQAARELDFVSVHIYPEAGKVEEAVETLRGFGAGKPVVVEETFPLRCGAGEVEEFLRRSREYACGWMGHYDGTPAEELEERRRSGTITMAEAVYLAWLELFRGMRGEMAGGWDRP